MAALPPLSQVSPVFLVIFTFVKWRNLIFLISLWKVWFFLTFSWVYFSKRGVWKLSLPIRVCFVAEADVAAGWVARAIVSIIIFGDNVLTLPSFLANKHFKKLIKDSTKNTPKKQIIRLNNGYHSEEFSLILWVAFLSKHAMFHLLNILDSVPLSLCQRLAIVDWHWVWAIRHTDNFYVSFCFLFMII